MTPPQLRARSGKRAEAREACSRRHWGLQKCTLAPTPEPRAAEEQTVRRPVTAARPGQPLGDPLAEPRWLPLHRGDRAPHPQRHCCASPEGHMRWRLPGRAPGSLPAPTPATKPPPLWPVSQPRGGASSTSHLPGGGQAPPWHSGALLAPGQGTHTGPRGRRTRKARGGAANTGRKSPSFSLVPRGLGRCSGRPPASFPRETPREPPASGRGRQRRAILRVSSLAARGGRG